MNEILSTCSNVHLYLTRKNLETLLAKLDNPLSARTIIKSDTVHPIYPLTGASYVTITALENEEYYTDRDAGIMLEDIIGANDEVSKPN